MCEVTGLTGESVLFFRLLKRPRLPPLVVEDVRVELVTTGAGSECLKRGMLTICWDEIGSSERLICLGLLRAFVKVRKGNVHK